MREREGKWQIIGLFGLQHVAVLTDCSVRPPCSVDSEAPGRTPPPPPPRVPGRSARCPNYHKLQQSQWTLVRRENRRRKNVVWWFLSLLLSFGRYASHRILL